MLMSQSLTSLFVFTEPFPLQIALIAIFAGVILVLVATILGILFRKRICCPNHDDKDGDKTSGTSTESSGNHKFDTNPDFHSLTVYLMKMSIINLKISMQTCFDENFAMISCLLVLSAVYLYLLSNGEVSNFISK